MTNVPAITLIHLSMFTVTPLKKDFHRYIPLRKPAGQDRRMRRAKHLPQATYPVTSRTVKGYGYVHRFREAAPPATRMAIPPLARNIKFQKEEIVRLRFLTAGLAPADCFQPSRQGSTFIQASRRLRPAPQGGAGNACRPRKDRRPSPPFRRGGARRTAPALERPHKVLGSRPYEIPYFFIFRHSVVRSIRRAAAASLRFQRCSSRAATIRSLSASPDLRAVSP